MAQAKPGLSKHLERNAIENERPADGRDEGGGLWISDLRGGNRSMTTKNSRLLHDLVTMNRVYNKNRI
jgi:hypothetical protein